MSQLTERTRLLAAENKPHYSFDTSIASRERKRRVKQFQCCLCAIFICIFVVGIVVTIAFSISTSDLENENNETITNVSFPIDSFLILLSNNWPLPDKNEINENCTNKTSWDDAMLAGQRDLHLKDEIEKNTTSLPLNSPSYKHQKIVATSAKARAFARRGHQEEFATRHFMRNKNKRIARICNHNMTKANVSPICKEQSTECKIQKFRTYNGTCNNVNHPLEFGVTYRPFRRVLPADYGDNISQPRLAQNGKPLPSARTVSLEVHRPYYKDDDKFSVILAVWGQFLDHDITATALSQGVNGTSISCCKNNTHPECFPVMLDSFDPFSRYNVTCMEFVRSAPAPTCCLGPREQMNQATSFIDGSVVYGTDEDVVSKLRTMKDGLLDMYITEDNRTLLPVSNDLTDGCNRITESKNGRYCFLTGDARANENLHLTSMHLIWARQHNRLAKTLLNINPHWNDERIFQESRKILGAQMQHITYKEFLPILLGQDLMQKFHLNPKKNSYFTKYNDSIDPSVANNFATAAFRFAHSIIPGLMKLLANDTSSPEFVQMHRMLLDPFKLYQPGELDRALRGAMDTTIEANDPFFTDEDDDENSSAKAKQCGLDLVSLNIQRGRDHGLLGYNSWRDHCGLRRARTFDELVGDIDGESLRNIRSVYRNVEDIDLYTGALSERPLNGSILGPTITCLILDQFVRIKFGDRFWYENPNWFTLEQLEEIRKTSLAKIICDNSDKVEMVQPFVMEKIRRNNELKPCKFIKGPDLESWQEKEGFHHVELISDSVSVKHQEKN